MRKSCFPVVLASCFLSLAALPSCFNDHDISSNNYEEWRNQNTLFLEEAATETDGGVLKYEKIIPDWDNSVFTLLRWIEKGQTGSTVTPITTSTVKVKYTLRNIEGDTLDQSAAFKCRPLNLVTGFQIALYNMEVGDSVEALVPYTAGYGEYGYSSILPYSTLVFSIRLDSIVAYQSLPWRP